MFSPATCDNSCKDCQMNADGWCTWKDKATPYYEPHVYKATANNTIAVEDLHIHFV